MMPINASAVEIALRHVVALLRGAALAVSIDATYAVDQSLSGVYVSQVGATRPQRAIGGGRVAESVTLRVLCSAPGREYGAVKTLAERVRQVLDATGSDSLGVYQCEVVSELSAGVPTRGGDVDSRVALTVIVAVCAPV
jgi:hypothetical protein